MIKYIKIHIRKKLISNIIYVFSWKKELKKKIIEYELNNNPDFDDAFPDFKFYKPKTTLKKKEKELDFLKSLGLHSRITK